MVSACQFSKLDCDFLWQTQHLVMLECYKVNSSEITFGFLDVGTSTGNQSIT